VSNHENDKTYRYTSQMKAFYRFFINKPQLS